MTRRLRTAFPVADSAVLGRAARRASAGRAVLGLLLAALLGIALWTAPHARGARPTAAARGSTVVVLDVSSSVDGARGAIHDALTGIIRSVGPLGRVGFVLFSNTAEEALPAGTPVAELASFLRYFPAAHRGIQSVVATDPWSDRFSLGTTISTGFAAARRMVEQEARVSRVVLISDLGDAPDDGAALRRELLALGRDGVRVEARELPGAAPADRALFRRLLGRDALAKATAKPPAIRGATAPRPDGLPLPLLVLTIVVAAALGLNELLAVSVRWRPAEAR